MFSGDFLVEAFLRHCDAWPLPVVEPPEEGAPPPPPPCYSDERVMRRLAENTVWMWLPVILVCMHDEHLAPRHSGLLHLVARCIMNVDQAPMSLLPSDAHRALAIRLVVALRDPRRDERVCYLLRVFSEVPERMRLPRGFQQLEARETILLRLEDDCNGREQSQCDLLANRGLAAVGDGWQLQRVTDFLTEHNNNKRRVVLIEFGGRGGAGKRNRLSPGLLQYALCMGADAPGAISYRSLIVAGDLHSPGAMGGHFWLLIDAWTWHYVRIALLKALCPSERRTPLAPVLVRAWCYRPRIADSGYRLVRYAVLRTLIGWIADSTWSAWMPDRARSKIVHPFENATIFSYYDQLGDLISKLYTNDAEMHADIIESYAVVDNQEDLRPTLFTALLSILALRQNHSVSAELIELLRNDIYLHLASNDIDYSRLEFEDTDSESSLLDLSGLCIELGRLGAELDQDTMRREERFWYPVQSALPFYRLLLFHHSWRNDQSRQTMRKLVFGIRLVGPFGSGGDSIGGIAKSVVPVPTAISGQRTWARCIDDMARLVDFCEPIDPEKYPNSTGFEDETVPPSDGGGNTWCFPRLIALLEAMRVSTCDQRRRAMKIGEIRNRRAVIHRDELSYRKSIPVAIRTSLQVLRRVNGPPPPPRGLLLPESLAAEEARVAAFFARPRRKRNGGEPVRPRERHYERNVTNTYTSFEDSLAVPKEAPLLIMHPLVATAPEHCAPIQMLNDWLTVYARRFLLDELRQ